MSESQVAPMASPWEPLGRHRPLGAMSASQREVTGPECAMRRVLQRFDGRLRAASRRLAAGDEDFAEDLLQEAHVALFELDASRYTADDDAFLCRKMVWRMWEVTRRERGRPDAARSGESTAARDSRPCERFGGTAGYDSGNSQPNRGVAEMS